MSEEGMDVVEFANNFKDRTNHPGFKLVISNCVDEIEQLRAENEKLKAQVALWHQASDERDEAIIKEVAADCAEMADNDYSAADVAVEIREKYGIESPPCPRCDRTCNGYTRSHTEGDTWPRIDVWVEKVLVNRANMRGEIDDE